MSFKIEQNSLISLNPATEEEVGRVPYATKEQVSEAVQEARKALLSWSQLSFSERVHKLKQGLEQLLAEHEKLGTLITKEMGKPLLEGIGEAKYAISHTLEELIPLTEKAQTPERIEEKKLITNLYYVPRGIVAIITPWNFPVSLSLDAIIPALLLGNTVVFKPSEYVPLVGEQIAKTLNKFLPTGVLNLIQGDGPIGELLINEKIDMVAFVGSQEVGKHIMEAQAKKLNPVILEMGGKDPMIVLEDADIEEAAKFAVSGSLRNSGQVCVSVERIYVLEPIAELFENKVREKMQAFKMGDPLEKEIRMGPMVSENQRQKVLSQLEDAQKKGAKIEGGNSLQSKGFFLSPALATQLNENMELMQKETFGPVIAIQRVQSKEEALEKANQLSYGLGGTVWGQDESQAEKIASALETGMIGINRGIGGAANTPFVGAKQSSIGYFGGIEGIRQFAQIRKITKNKKT